MLTKEDRVAEFRDGRAFPDKLTRSKHGHYVELASQMLEIYRDGIGSTRDDLHEAVRTIFWAEEECPPRRVRAFQKLLDDRSNFDGLTGSAASELRIRIFKLSASRHPLVKVPAGLLESEEETVKEEISKRLGRPWLEIEETLFSDVYGLHRLKAFEGYESANALLSRYNEAQAQALLYDATEMTVEARSDFRSIVMAAKRARLMHIVERLGDGHFRFVFAGPATALRETRRYGIDLAKVLPALVACRDWEMVAPIKKFKNGRQPVFKLSSRDKYKSSRAVLPEFDSKLEREFAAKWGTESRDGWTLERESEPRFIGQKAIFPDFVFRHETGKIVLFEIVGHWTPEYLKTKKETLAQFRDEPILLALQQVKAETFTELDFPIVPYKTTLIVKPILEALVGFR